MGDITAKISRDGRVTIPVSVREHLELQPGDKVFFVTTDDGRIELRATRLSLDDVLGSIEALPNESLDLDREIEAAKAEHLARKKRTL